MQGALKAFRREERRSKLNYKTSFYDIMILHNTHFEPRLYTQQWPKLRKIKRLRLTLARILTLEAFFILTSQFMAIKAEYTWRTVAKTNGFITLLLSWWWDRQPTHSPSWLRSASCGSPRKLAFCLYFLRVFLDGDSAENADPWKVQVNPFHGARKI